MKIDFGKLTVKVNLFTIIRLANKIRKLWKKYRRENVLEEKETGSDVTGKQKGATVRNK